MRHESVESTAGKGAACLCPHPSKSKDSSSHSYVQLQYPLPNDLVATLGTSDYSFSLNANAIKYHREWKQEITAGVEVELERAPLVWS
jgi:hypothetical protein